MSNGVRDNISLNLPGKTDSFILTGQLHLDGIHAGLIDQKTFVINFWFGVKAMKPVEL